MSASSGLVRTAFFVSAHLALVVWGGTVLYGYGVEYYARRSANLHQGDVLPAPDQVDVGRDPRTLLIAVRAGCEFVQRGMPFYRRLADAKARGEIAVGMVVLGPDDDDMLRTLLRIHGVRLPRLARVPLRALKLQGTPTLLLVDRERRILRIWDGYLTPSEEGDVLATVGTSTKRTETADR